MKQDEEKVEMKLEAESNSESERGKWHNQSRVLRVLNSLVYWKHFNPFYSIRGL